MYDIYGIVSKINEIEREAIKNTDIPAGYTPPEQLLFLSLRVLHWEYRQRVISKAQAVAEKKRLSDEYVKAARFY